MAMQRRFAAEPEIGDERESLRRFPGELRIGEFAALAGVSPKALRLYAAEGLLQPSRINQANGYRYYQPKQLETVHRIKLLQAVGASLREIKLAIEAEAVLDDMEELLRRRQIEIGRQRALLDRQAAEIGRQLQQLEQHRRDVRDSEEEAAESAKRRSNTEPPVDSTVIVDLEESMNERNDERGTGYSRRGVIAGVAGGALSIGLGTKIAGASGSSRVRTGTRFYQADNNVYRYAADAPVTTAALDPSNYYRIHYAMGGLYSRLCANDLSLAPVPDLAVSWEPNATLDRWTFKLREGVTWHDGEPFTSADVAFSYKRMLDPNVSSVSATYAIVDPDGIETPDDLTVVIALNKPHADFPQLAMGAYAYIVPEHIGDDVPTAGIGTGPYKLVEADPAGITAMEAFDAYWRGPAKINRVELYTIADSEARVNGLLANQLDGAGSLSPLQLQRIGESPDHQVKLVPDGSWTYLGVRCDTAPFDDVRVRKAMKLVVDRAQIHQAAIQSSGTIGYDQPVWEHDQYGWVGDPARNVEQAKALLAEAGFPNGLDVTLEAADIHYWLPIAVTYKEQAKEAGINVTINMVPSDGDYSLTVKDSVFRFEQWGARTADTVLTEAFRSDAAANDSRWKRPEFDALLDSARAEADFEKRKDLYQQAQQMINDDGGVILPFFGYTGFAAAKRVQGIPAKPTDLNSFWTLSYS
jgi:peptide/nickel transport system substrate-binding protein